MCGCSSRDRFLVAVPELPRVIAESDILRGHADDPGTGVAQPPPMANARAGTLYARTKGLHGYGPTVPLELCDDARTAFPAGSRAAQPRDEELTDR